MPLHPTLSTDPVWPPSATGELPESYREPDLQNFLARPEGSSDPVQRRSKRELGACPSPGHVVQIQSKRLRRGHRRHSEASHDDSHNVVDSRIANPSQPPSDPSSVTSQLDSATGELPVSYRRATRNGRPMSLPLLRMARTSPTKLRDSAPTTPTRPGPLQFHSNRVAPTALSAKGRRFSQLDRCPRVLGSRRCDPSEKT